MLLENVGHSRLEMFLDMSALNILVVLHAVEEASTRRIKVKLKPIFGSHNYDMDFRNVACYIFSSFSYAQGDQALRIQVIYEIVV